MTLTEWFNQEADIPMQNENGEWYDLETGLSFKHFSDNSQPKIVVEKTKNEEEFGRCKVNAVKSAFDRRINNVEYTINKQEGSYDVSAHKEILKKGANTKLTKKNMIAILDMISDADRDLNKRINK